MKMYPRTGVAGESVKVTDANVADLTARVGAPLWPN